MITGKRKLHDIIADAWSRMRFEGTHHTASHLDLFTQAIQFFRSIRHINPTIVADKTVARPAYIIARMSVLELTIPVYRAIVDPNMIQDHVTIDSVFFVDRQSFSAVTKYPMNIRNCVRIFGTNPVPLNPHTSVTQKTAIRPEITRHHFWNLENIIALRPRTLSNKTVIRILKAASTLAAFAALLTRLCFGLVQ